ncbi:MAG: choice-of-anchor Q domain-containing protein [Comamonas sp.]
MKPTHRILASAALLLAAAGAQGAVCHATPTGSGDGSSWTQAAALPAALADASCTEIRLRQGVYRPGGGPNTAFVIERPLQLRGGYTGTGDARVLDPANTVLSGDIGDDDANRTPTGITPAAGDIVGINNGRVLVIGGMGNPGTGSYTSDPAGAGYTLIEGLTITAAGGASGLTCNGLGTGRECSPRLRLLHLRGNSSVLGGGGGLMLAGSGSPVIEQARFSGNTSSTHGGAIYIKAPDASGSPAIQVHILQTVFEDNTAVQDGGAIYHHAKDYANSTLRIVDSTFARNSAGRDGGALHNWGDGGKAYAPISNSSFHANNADNYGGAISNDGRHLGTGSPAIAGSTFTGNQAGSMGGAVYSVELNGFSPITIRGSILWGNTARTWPQFRDSASSGTVSHSIVQGGHAGTGILDMDPELGPLQDNGGPTPTRLPGPGSAALDMVDCGALELTADQRGLARPQGAACDMGAVERRATSVLKVELAGSAGGSVSGGLGDCALTTAGCTAAYGEGDPLGVTLSATASPGHVFDGWSGDCSGSTCTTQLTQDRKVIAHFSAILPASHALGGSTTGLATGTTLALRNGDETLQIDRNGSFHFTTPVAHGGSYAVSVQTQPPGQRCTVANASGNNVSEDVGNVTVACAPYVEGTTVPASGPGGPASATFSGGGEGCRFDPEATAFEAAPAALPAGRTLPQGMFRFKLVGCEPAATVRVSVTWPQSVAAYLKHGKASRTAAQDGYYDFTPEHQLAIDGQTVSFSVKDGALGDDDWNENGEIADPSGPSAAAVPPGGVQPTPVPASGSGALALLGVLLAVLAWRRRV